MSARVLVGIVTCNSAPYLEACLEGLGRQTFRDFDTALFDNASRDGTAAIVGRHRDRFRSVCFSGENLGFAAAHNRLIGPSRSEYVLVLNPDVILDARFLETLVAAMDGHPEAGAATGKLYRWRRHPGAPAAPAPPRGPAELDSTGIYFTSNQRHLDRGSGEYDTGQYDREEWVFGASGAAAFYRRAMLEDVRTGGEYFDESFFAYREDADLAWRARWMVWPCLYVPGATALHERKVLPQRRASVPEAINMHSFKNRFLLRVKNMDPGTYARNFLRITARDLLAVGYVLVRERSSLRGLPLIARALPGALAARRELKRRRRAAPREIRAWLSGRRSEPLGLRPGGAHTRR